MTRSRRWPPILLSRPLGSGLAVTAAVALVTGAAMWSRREEWWGWLPSTVSVWVTHACIGGPSIVAAAAAWWAGASHRSGLDEWVRGSGLRRRADIVSTSMAAFLFGAVGLVIPLAVAVCMSITAGGQPTLPWASSVLAVLSVLLATASAALVAAWVATKAPAPVAVTGALVVPYLWFFSVVMLGSSIPAAAVVGPADGISWDYVATSGSTAGVRALTWFVVLVSLISAITRHRTRELLPWCIGGALAAAVFAGFAVVPLPGSTQQTCAGERPTICLLAPQEASRDELTATVHAVLGAVPQGLWPATLQSADAPSGAGAVLPVDKVIDPDEVAGRVGTELFLGSCTDGSVGSGSAQALLAWWWAAHGLDPSAPAYPGAPTSGAGLDPGPESDRLALLSRDERDALLGGLAPAIRRCALDRSALR